MTRHLIETIRKHVDQCSHVNSQCPGCAWCRESDELVNRALHFLKSNGRNTDGVRNVADKHERLRILLKALNQSESLDILRQPMVQLTIAGIVFMILMTLGIIGAYYWFF